MSATSFAWPSGGGRWITVTGIMFIASMVTLMRSFLAVKLFFLVLFLLAFVLHAYRRRTSLVVYPRLVWFYLWIGLAGLLWAFVGALHPANYHQAVFDGLKLWLGAEFAQHSFRVLQLLAVGVFANSLAQVPFAFLQGVGRPDLTATLHLVELPLYLGLLWWLIGAYGIEGAAIAWTARVGVDACFLFMLSKRFLHGKNRVRVKAALFPVLALLILGLAAKLEGPVVKALFLSGTILCFLLVTWFRILTPEERTLAQSYR